MPLSSELKLMIGQMVMVGFDGTALSPDLEHMIRKYHPGGVIIFKRNLSEGEYLEPNLIELITNIQNLSADLPHFISVDQEGGRVFRLGEPFTQLPEPAKLGEIYKNTGKASIAFDLAKIIATELKAIGINFDLAPVLDVNTNKANPIINTRAFSEDPEIVSRLGVEFTHGLQDHGVIACGKHFPGHGDTAEDSHLALPVVKHTKERFMKIEIPPFKKAIDSGVETIMTAHVSYPNLDPDLPATMSKRIITGILREDLGFHGLVITDDLNMKAIADNYSLEDTVINVIEAGCDILLICQEPNRQEAAIKAIYEAVENGRISRDRIIESYERIKECKEIYLASWQPLSEAYAKYIIGCLAHREKLKQIFSKA